MDPMRVLIVDDEQELVATLVERLDIRGIDAEGVGSGAEALEKIRERLDRTVDDFVGLAGPSDDRTLLLLRRE